MPTPYSDPVNTTQTRASWGCAPRPWCSAGFGPVSHFVTATPHGLLCGQTEDHRPWCARYALRLRAGADCSPHPVWEGLPQESGLVCAAVPDTSHRPRAGWYVTDKFTTPAGAGVGWCTCSVRVLDSFHKADEQVQSGPRKADVEVRPAHRFSQRLLVTDPGVSCAASASALARRNVRLTPRCCCPRSAAPHAACRPVKRPLCSCTLFDNRSSTA